MKKNYLGQARWLSLLIFPVGFLLTEEAFADTWGSYAALNLLSFLSGGIIMWRLRRISLENLVVWFVWLVLLLGYYYKFYSLVYGLIQGKSKIALSFIAGSVAPLVASISILYECFVIITVSLFAVAITSHFLLRKGKTNIIQPVGYSRSKNVYNWALITFRLLALALFLGLISGYLRKHYQLGVPYIAVYLPYKLAGIITVTNGIIVPMLINLALLSALRSERQRLVLLSAGMFFLWGVLAFILFTSKTDLLLPLVIIFAAGVLYGRPILKMRYLAWYGGIFLLIYPFLNLFRSVSNYFSGRSSSFLISEMLRVGSEVEGVSGVSGFLMLANRVTGIDSVVELAAARHNYTAFNLIDYLLGRVDSPEEIITAMHHTPYTGVAASLLGQAYFVTGSYLMTAVWITGWLVLAYWLTAALMKRNTLFAQNALLFWLVMVLQWSADGITYFKIELFVVAILVTYLITHFVKISCRHTAVRVNRI
jgi:uncharacterized protein with PQ loop repeat